jgi:hypothetical protein
LADEFYIVCDEESEDLVRREFLRDSDREDEEN